MEAFLFVLNIVGYASTVLVIISAIWGIVLWYRGIAPVLLRLGKGLATRRIAILAGGDEQTSLKSLLVDSGVFRKKNIISVVKSGDIGRAEKATLYVIHWPSWENSLDELLAKKSDTTGLVVYAPHEDGQLPDDVMAKLNQQRNVTVTNFRGRLLSDILVSMMTTSCAQ
jgi:hypothetical protein